MNIVLIGFMGVGKSAVGQQLAQQLGFQYLDTDELIEKKEQLSINEIFRQKGEEHFRDRETQQLRELQGKNDYVIATGGGMIIRDENVTLMKALGPVILLWSDPEMIYERVKNETQRPLLNVPDPLAEIKKILGFRMPNYKRAADLKVDTSKLTVTEAVTVINQWLKLKSN